MPNLHASYSMLRKFPDAIVHDTARQVVTADRRLICEVLPCDRMGTNNEVMTKYIELLLTGCSLP